MLVTRHWVENRKRYGLGLLAMGGLLATWFGFILSVERFVPLDPFDQSAAYYCGLYFVGCLYASTIFSDLGSKAKGINWLSVPASHLEKLLCAIFFCVVLFFLSFTLLFYLVDIPMIGLSNHLISSQHRLFPGTLTRIPPNEVLNIFKMSGLTSMPNDHHLLLLVFFAAQSAFLLGSVYFARYSFIKTTIAALLIILACVTLIIKGVQEHIPGPWRMDDLVRWVQYKNMFDQSAQIRLPEWIDKILIFLTEFAAPILLWIITYFRLKEKEV